jgi:hypothetical protein
MPRQIKLESWAAARRAFIKKQGGGQAEVGKFQHLGNILETKKLNNTVWQPAV